MQVSAGMPVTWTEYFRSTNYETSDEHRNLEFVNAGGRNVDSAHMFSQAQHTSFTDMLMEPSDQGMCNFCIHQLKKCNPDHVAMMPSQSKPAQKQFSASQEQQPDTVASVAKLIGKSTSNNSRKGSAASQQNPAGKVKWTEAEEQWLGHPHKSSVSRNSVQLLLSSIAALLVRAILGSQ